MQTLPEFIDRMFGDVVDGVNHEATPSLDLDLF